MALALARAGILDHWDMWSSRNYNNMTDANTGILDHWDMWSSRNGRVHQRGAGVILDH